MKKIIKVKNTNCEKYTDQQIKKHLIREFSFIASKELSPHSLGITRKKSEEFHGYENEAEFIVFDKYGLEGYTAEIIEERNDEIKKIITCKDIQIDELTKQVYCLQDTLSTIQACRPIQYLVPVNEKLDLRLTQAEKDIRGIKKTLRGV